MPWSQTTPMDQKTQFIAHYLRQTFSFTELCARYGVSRETGYRLLTVSRLTLRCLNHRVRRECNAARLPSTLNSCCT
jgi:putative transposase